LLLLVLGCTRPGLAEPPAGTQTTPPATIEKKPVQAGIGASVLPMDAVLALLKKKKFALPPRHSGVMVFDTVAGSPAQAAGLRRLDIITKIGETPIGTQKDFSAAVNALAVGRPARFYLLRPDLSKRTDVWKARMVVVRPITAAAVDRLKEHECPLRLVSATLRRNEIGLPEVWLTVKNPKASDAVAVEVKVECWNRFDDKVLDWSKRSHVFAGIAQKTIARGGEETMAWQLTEHDQAAKIHVTVSRVKFADGTIWKDEKSEESTGLKAELPD
jgi:hypothetical protein